MMGSIRGCAFAGLTGEATSPRHVDSDRMHPSVRLLPKRPSMKLSIFSRSQLL
jgi:hypothetical protein